MNAPSFALKIVFRFSLATIDSTHLQHSLHEISKKIVDCFYLPSPEFWICRLAMFLLLCQSMDCSHGIMFLHQHFQCNPQQLRIKEQSYSEVSSPTAHSDKIIINILAKERPCRLFSP